MLMCSLPRHLRPGKGCPDSKGMGVGERSRWSWAGWWQPAVGQQSPGWDTGGWTAGGERDGDSPPVVQKEVSANLSLLG